MNSLLATLLSAENMWQESHQRHHWEPLNAQQCETCQFTQLSDEWTSITIANCGWKLKQHNQLLIDLILKITTIFLHTLNTHSARLTSIESVMEIVDMAWRLVGNQHSHRNSTTDLNRLLALAMATLQPTNLALKKDYTVIWQILQNQKDAQTFNEFHKHLLETVLSCDLRQFSATMKAAFVDGFRNAAHDFWRSHQIVINLHFLMYDLISVADLMETINRLDVTQKIVQETIAKSLQPLVCAVSADYLVFYSVDTFQTTIRCNVCCRSADNALPKDCVYVNRSVAPSPVGQTDIERILAQLITSESITVRLSVVDALLAVATHIPGALTKSPNTINMTELIGDSSIDVLHSLGVVLPDVLSTIRNSSAVSKMQTHRFFDTLMTHISKEARLCLSRSDGARQAAVLNIIRAIGCQRGLPEDRVLQTFLLITLFVIRPESLESKHAALCADEICVAANTNPRQLVCWYKEDVFKLLVAGAVNNFMRHGYGLNKSLTNVSVVNL